MELLLQLKMKFKFALMIKVSLDVYIFVHVQRRAETLLSDNFWFELLKMTCQCCDVGFLWRSRSWYCGAVGLTIGMPVGEYKIVKLFSILYNISFLTAVYTK